MARRTDIFDLGRLALASGEGRTVGLDVGVDTLEFGGQRYQAAAGAVRADLEVARTRSGYAMRLRYEARLAGPCTRCLEGAGATVAVDAREVDQPGGGEETRSPYLDGDDLDVRAWARDALALAVPARILCRDDCRGLCAVCGENLNDAGAEHRHEEARDPRWAKLDELRRG